MAGEKNLIPFSKRSKEEAREFGRKGGRASGAARRRKRSLKEAADVFLSLPVADTDIWNGISALGIDPEDIDNQMAVIVRLWNSAIRNDDKAAELLFRILGEEPKSKDTEETQGGVIVMGEVDPEPEPPEEEKDESNLDTPAQTADLPETWRI